jgi:hypothetical protein
MHQEESVQTGFVFKLVNHALVQRQIPEIDRQAHVSQLFRLGIGRLGMRLGFGGSTTGCKKKP